VNNAMGELIIAYQESRVAKALEDIRSARSERLEKSMALDAEVLEEHRRWARSIWNTGAGRLVIRRSAFVGGSTMDATMIERAGALDEALGELDGMIKSMDARDAQRLAKAQPGAPEGRQVTRGTALTALAAAVQSGAVSMRTAGMVEERVNSGRMTPAVLMKALTTEARMQKSKTEITVLDAQKALQRALDVRAITFVEWQTGQDHLADGRSTPHEIYEALIPRIRAKAPANPVPASSSSRHSVDDGHDYERLQARHQAFKENPLATTFR
jgi:hypothetical protein